MTMTAGARDVRVTATGNYAAAIAATAVILIAAVSKRAATSGNIYTITAVARRPPKRPQPSLGRWVSRSICRHGSRTDSLNTTSVAVTGTIAAAETPPVIEPLVRLAKSAFPYRCIRVEHEPRSSLSGMRETENTESVSYT